MNKYLLKNRSTKDEVEVKAETLLAACARLGWIPTMTEIRLLNEDVQD